MGFGTDAGAVVPVSDPFGSSAIVYAGESVAVVQVTRSAGVGLLRAVAGEANKSPASLSCTPYHSPNPSRLSGKANAVYPTSPRLGG